MTPAGLHMRRSLALVLVPLAAACAFASPAAAMTSSSPLSPNLAELAKPSVQGLSHAAQARKVGVAVEGPGSLVREGNRVLVEVSFDHGAIARLDALRAAGGRIVAASRRYQTVTVAVSPEALHELADVAGVGSVQEVRAPVVYGAGEGTTSAVGAECEGGSVVSEGLDQLHVKDAWSKYGVNGAGVTVGALSDSYDKATHVAGSKTQLIATHAEEDVESGDLPGPANGCTGEQTEVDVLEDIPASKEKEATDEGRAMLQIVHDIAPSAGLAFATAYKGETAFAENIERLAKPVIQEGAGARVIVDDVGYFEEPFFQEGPVAVAVDNVASQGVSYFSAAGNDNLFEGNREIASWEAPEFRDAGTCPAVVGSAETHCMDFNPGAGKDNEFEITVLAHRTLTIDLQWAEPWHEVKADLDAFLLNGSGKLLASSHRDNVGSAESEGTQRPVEVVQWENTGSSSAEVFLAINRCFGLTCNPAGSSTAKPPLKFALLENGRGVTKTEYPVSKEGDTVGPTIFGHTAAKDAVSVAAIHYGADEEPESYSSRGPVKYFFEPVNGTTPAAPTSETIAKPEITATDCGATTFFASLESDAMWHFCGTSAAAPHAAGVAALELQADPSATPDEIRDAQTSTAAPIGTFGHSAVGAGLLDADAAVGTFSPSMPTTVTLTEHPENRTRDTTPTFEFSASPSPAEYTCSLVESGASGTAQPCSSPYEPSGPLPDGAYTFTVNALDGGSNVLGSASFSFTVDTTPPTIGFAKKPGAFTSTATPEFRFSTSEPAAFECALDGEAAKPCASPFIPPALSEGPHTLVVTAADQVGNEAKPVEAKFTVDTTPPVVAFTAQPREITSEDRPTFGFAVSETATLSCSLDESPLQPCESPFTVREALSNGPHTFEAGATDRAGNAGYATVRFTVDTKRPQTSFAAHPHKVVRTRERKVVLAFRFHSSEPGSNFICKVDRNLFRFCQPRIVRRFKTGTHVVEVKAQDAAGNVDRTPAVFRFKVKRIR